MVKIEIKGVKYTLEEAKEIHEVLEKIFSEKAKYTPAPMPDYSKYPWYNPLIPNQPYFEITSTGDYGYNI